MQSGQCRGRPRAGRALISTYVVCMTMAVNGLAMAWPRNACGAPRAAFAAQDQAYGVLAGTRGAWGVLFSLCMMSYEVSEYLFFQYLYKSYLRLAGSGPEPPSRVMDSHPVQRRQWHSGDHSGRRSGARGMLHCCECSR